MYRNSHNMSRPPLTIYTATSISGNEVESIMLSLASA
jgi:hypothetical protein